jgi:hypothetical protein
VCVCFFFELSTSFHLGPSCPNLHLQIDMPFGKVLAYNLLLKLSAFVYSSSMFTFDRAVNSGVQYQTASPNFFVLFAVYGGCLVSFVFCLLPCFYLLATIVCPSAAKSCQRGAERIGMCDPCFDALKNAGETDEKKKSIEMRLRRMKTADLIRIRDGKAGRITRIKLLGGTVPAPWDIFTFNIIINAPVIIFCAFALHNSSFDVDLSVDTITDQPRFGLPGLEVVLEIVIFLFTFAVMMYEKCMESKANQQTAAATAAAATVH